MCSSAISIYGMPVMDTAFHPQPSERQIQAEEKRVMASLVFGLEAIHVVLDPPVDVHGDFIEVKSVVDALDRLFDTGFDALGDGAGRGGKVGDVLLPARSPLLSLVGHAGLGAGQHHVQWCEARNTGDSKGETLRASRGGNSDGHCVEEEEVGIGRV